MPPSDAEHMIINGVVYFNEFSARVSRLGREFKPVSLSSELPFRQRPGLSQLGGGLIRGYLGIMYLIKFKENNNYFFMRNTWFYYSGKVRQLHQSIFHQFASKLRCSMHKIKSNVSAGETIQTETSTDPIMRD